MKNDVVENWIVNVGVKHSKSEYTRRRYSRELKVFTDFIGKKAEQIIDENEKITTFIAEKKFRQKYVRLLNALTAKMDKEGYAPNTINSVVIAVKSFFKYSGLKHVLDDVSVRKIKVKFHNRDIEQLEIAQILAISRPRDKAFFCMMAQGGLRPNILADLKYEHIQKDFESGIVPMEVYVPSEIAKGEYGSFFTFVGEESVKYLKAYLMKRPNIQSNDYLFTSHGTNKRLCTRSLSKIFAHAIKKLEEKGVIKNVKRMEMRSGKYMADVRLYNLRKFFRKYARQAGIDYMNFWMGHKTNYKASHIPSSDEHYFSKEDVEYHRKLYAEKAMPFLRIEASTPTETEQTIEKLREQLKERNGIIKEQNERLEKLEVFEKRVIKRLGELTKREAQLNELERVEKKVDAKLSELKKAEDYIRSIQSEMKYFEKGNVVVTYFSKAGFLPGELEEIADEGLERRKEDHRKEIEEIDKALRKPKKDKTK